MASALRLTGDLAAVGGYLETAMNIHLELGSRFGQAEVLNQTGDFLLQSGDPVRAAAVYQRAQRLAREVHSVREEAHALRGAAHCALDQHNVGSAIDQLREARLMYRGIGAPDADSIATELAELTSSAPDAA